MQAARRLKSPSKSHQKSIKIIAKMIQNRGLEGVLAALGRLLGGSWLQGTSGPLTGCLSSCSWVVLEASWAPVGRLLGRLGHQVRASWGILEATWGRLGRIFTPK